jgi:pimeloyl-ACP methyl ester carboxylesterase
VRQRLERHRDLHAVADALRAVPRSRPFQSLDDLERLDVPALVVGSRDEADPGHPLAVAEEYARRIPGARLLVEEPGKSPLAWQGAQLSRAIDEFVRAGYS